jgi:hypothetical protein
VKIVETKSDIDVDEKVQFSHRSESLCTQDRRLTLDHGKLRWPGGSTLNTSQILLEIAGAASKSSRITCRGRAGREYLSEKSMGTWEEAP